MGDAIIFQILHGLDWRSSDPFQSAAANSGEICLIVSMTPEVGIYDSVIDRFVKMYRVKLYSDAHGVRDIVVRGDREVVYILDE